MTDANVLVFGKLPSHGDFVARGIAATRRDAVDRWLSASMAQAREALGAEFERLYDQAQPWRFAWRDDAGWTSGAMAPSVDAVGRRYPIIVAERGRHAGEVAACAASAEAAIYDALANGWTVDGIVVAVTDAALAAAEVWTSPPGWWTVDADGAVAARVMGETPADLIRQVLTFGA